MSKPIKAGTMNCAQYLFEKQELAESIAYWQQQDEDLNLEVINKHDMQTSTEEETAQQFQQELHKRNYQ